MTDLWPIHSPHTPYLIATPPRRSQFRFPRRATPTGGVVFHVTAPGHGHWSTASGTASFIRSRTDPGSYHVVVDPDELVELLPPPVEAFQATDGSNRYAYAISFACDPSTFVLGGTRTERALTLGAQCWARYAVWWASQAPGRDPKTAIRWSIPSDFRNGRPGAVEHRQIQSGRYDAFGTPSGAPRGDATRIRMRLANLAIEYLDTHHPTPSEEDDDMADQATKDQLARIELGIYALTTGLIPEGVNERETVGFRTNGLDSTTPTSNLYRWAAEMVTGRRPIDPRFLDKVAEHLPDRDPVTTEDLVRHLLEPLDDDARREFAATVVRITRELVGGAREGTAVPPSGEFPPGLSGGFTE